MIVEIKRWKSSVKGTEGDLYVDGVLFCNTLENPERGAWVKGLTAIPRGDYNCGFTYSPKFKRQMICIFGVPNCSGIRMHWGNIVANTDGCILVGQRGEVGSYFIGNSKATYFALEKKVNYSAFTLRIV